MSVYAPPVNFTSLFCFSPAGKRPFPTPRRRNVLYRPLERRLALLGGGRRDTPRRRNVPYRPLKRGLALLGGGRRDTPRRWNVPYRPLERRLALLGERKGDHLWSPSDLSFYWIAAYHRKLSNGQRPAWISATILYRSLRNLSMCSFSFAEMKIAGVFSLYIHECFNSSSE